MNDGLTFDAKLQREYDAEAEVLNRHHNSQFLSIARNEIKKKMALDNRYNSWADQWDTEPEYYNGYPGSKSNHGSGDGIKSKVGEGFDKSKAAAVTGMKKVKKGTTLGFHWIKEKCHKTTHK
uniref:Uncharacterized protein n=1 Tax=Lactuca sativa TaxID=4236 RepID=A0A9R1WG41_LACSA|nr:hypothetical protein LSAT_V11C100005460 [Lactuca sativa]